MPINREKFYRNRSIDEIKREVLDFLKDHPDKAFEEREIEEAIEAGPNEKYTLYFVFLTLLAEGVLDEQSEIVKPDGYHEVVKIYYILKKLSI